MVASAPVFRGGPVTPVAELYALQELDLALEASRAGIADTESRLDEPEELAGAREAVAERHEALRAAEKSFKEREYETDELRSKIEPLEKRLYQGSIQSPKELGDLQRDIESLKRRRSELEDKALEAMEALEQAQRALAEAERALREVTERCHAEQEEARARIAALTSEIADLERRRDEQAASIEAGLMQLYDRLAAIRQKRAVAKVEGGACQGCRISLPTNLIQRARSGSEIVQCSSCERILYVS